MTDRDKLKALLDKAGIIYEDIEHADDGEYINNLEVVAKAGPNNHGYYGFVSCFKFDESGTLISMGVWE